MECHGLSWLLGTVLLTLRTHLFTLYDINLLSHVRFSLTPEKVMITSFVCFIRKTISHSLSAQSNGSPYFDNFKT